MRPLDVERSILAVLAVPLAALTVAGGTLAVSSIDAAREPRRVRHLVDAVPDVLRLQRVLVAERADAASATVGDLAARRRLPVDRRATDEALGRAVESLADLRGDVPVVGAAAVATGRLASAVSKARRLTDTPGADGSAGTDDVLAGYAVATDLLVAVPRAVSSTLSARPLTAPAALLAAAVDTAESVARTRLAGDVLLRAGADAGRADADRLVARRAVLDASLARLSAAGVSLATTDLDRIRTADLVAAAAGPTGPERVAWDTAADHLGVTLTLLTRTASGDATAAASGVLRTRTLQALAAVLVVLGVVGGGVAHATFLGRRLRRTTVAPSTHRAGPDWGLIEDAVGHPLAAPAVRGFTEAPRSPAVPRQRTHRRGGWTQRPLGDAAPVTGRADAGVPVDR